jgi:hypothetical protein
LQIEKENLSERISSVIELVSHKGFSYMTIVFILYYVLCYEKYATVPHRLFCFTCDVFVSHQLSIFWGLLNYVGHNNAMHSISLRASPRGSLHSSLLLNLENKPKKHALKHSPSFPLSKTTLLALQFLIGYNTF